MYAFLAPAIIGFIWFYFYPTAMTFYMSLFRWGFNMSHTFIGLDNYVFAFTKNPIFWSTVQTTFTYAAASVGCSLIFGFILAAMLNRPRRTTGFFRTMFYLPCMVAAGAPTIMIWQWILGTNGVVNKGLASIGVQGPIWLASMPWAMISIVIIGLWSLGGMMIVFTAGLKGISDDYYEAANVDGAGYFTKLFKITLPMLTPVILYNTIISLITSLQVFTVVYILSTSGTNLNVWALSVYNQAFKIGAYGYASAEATLLFFVVMILAVVIFLTSGKWVFYGDH